MFTTREGECKNNRARERERESESDMSTSGEDPLSGEDRRDRET